MQLNPLIITTKSTITAAAAAALLIALSSAFELATPARPSYIRLDDVSQQYPVTLMDKLFSSVPKREYALKDINLTLGQNDNRLILLVGRSASGKSTILRLIAGMELATYGKVSINGQSISDLDDEGDKENTKREIVKGVASGMPPWIKTGQPLQAFVQPVILEGKPDFDNSLSVMERIVEMGCDAVRRYDESVNKDTLECLARDFVTLLGLDEQCSLSPLKLSPSEQYLFSIACGCMVSVAPSINKRHNDDDSSIPYPILLLDELFDTEVPGTVEKCNKGITNLIECGAVVISATHRPNYFKGMSTRVVTLSGGKVLTDTMTG